jgi:hypothetical protein
VQLRYFVRHAYACEPTGGQALSCGSADVPHAISALLDCSSHWEALAELAGIFAEGEKQHQGCRTVVGQGGILLQPLPASHCETYSSAIIPCVCTDQMHDHNEARTVPKQPVKSSG